jgi:hypothetical protein
MNNNTVPDTTLDKVVPTAVKLSQSSPNLRYRRGYLKDSGISVREAVFLDYLADKIKFHGKNGNLHIMGYCRAYHRIEADLGYAIAKNTLVRMVDKFVEKGILCKDTVHIPNNDGIRMYLKFKNAKDLNAIKTDNSDDADNFMVNLDSSVARLANIPTAVLAKVIPTLIRQYRSSEDYLKLGDNYDGWFPFTRSQLSEQTGLSYQEIRTGLAGLVKLGWIKVKNTVASNDQRGNLSLLKVVSATNQ